jgi:membrane protein YdbS with pleckstrin-like domain
LYQKWHIARQKGFAFNMIRQSLRASLLLIIGIILFQLFSYGYTWDEWITLVTPTTLLAIFIIVATLGIIAGFYSWRENEKRYNEIRHDYHHQLKPQ